MLRTAIIDGRIFQYESGTDEQYVLKEVLIDWCYPFDFKPTDVVLNLGGHIGAFELYAAPKVHTVITVEPVPESCAKIKRHLEINSIPNVALFEKAVGRYSGKAQFGLGCNNGHNGLIENSEPTDDIIEVETLALSHFFQYPITKIKCDIEGGEYEIFEDVLIPDSVNEMWLETHTFTEEQGMKHDRLIENFRQQDFKVEVIENDAPLHRTYLVHCTR